ncbi:MAG: hypothetical protein K6F39_00420 [Lachnospiraceae bacterium]|nr:hypothetical protein [Lachnospiraceae bacterium]
MRKMGFTRCVAALSAAALISCSICETAFVTPVFASEASAADEVDITKAEDKTWDFGSDSLTVNVQNETYLYDNMFIDATENGAKATMNGAQWTQVNEGTKFYFPVKGDAEIILKAYNKDAEQFEINGEQFEVSGDSNPFTYTYKYKGSAKVLELDVIKNGSYFESLTVKHTDGTQSENKKEEKESAKDVDTSVCAWDFTSYSDGEVNIQKKADYVQNIYVDASNGKFYTRSGDTQVNAGTKLYVPVSANETLYFTTNNGASISAEGSELKPAQADGEYLYSVKNGDKAANIEIVFNAQDYLHQIYVKENPFKKTEEITAPEETSEDVDYSDKFEYPVEYNEWDFTDYDAIKADAEMIQGADGYFRSLYIDAAKGKFNPRDNGGKDDAQVNAGTKIVVPLNKSTSGKAVLKVSYTQGAITVNGEEYSSGSEFTYEYSGYSYAVIECTSNTYIHEISASYPKSVFDSQESGEVDVWDFGGVSSNIAGAVDHIEADEYEQVSDLVASYDKVKKDKETGEVAFVKTVSEAFVSNGKFAADDLTLSYATGDRIYTEDGVGNTHKSTKKKGQFEFEDGYASSGYYYANGNGGSERRYVEIANVEAGNIIDIYMDSKNVEEKAHFVNDSGEQDEVFTVSTTPSKYEFIAEYDGNYKIYTETGNNGKADFFRVVRRTDTVVQGKVDFGSLETPENYRIVLTDEESGEEIEAEVDTASDKYAAYIKAGKQYKTSIKDAAGYAVTDATAEVEADAKDAVSRTTHDLKIEAVDTVTVSGKVSGFENGFDVSSVKLVFTNAEGGSSYAALDAEGNYSAEVNAGTENSASLENCFDYVIKNAEAFTADADMTKNYEVEKTLTYKVSGKLLNIPAGTEVSEITFTNKADKQSYKGTVNGLEYSAELRNGTYTAAIDNDDYVTKTTVTVADSFVEKDLYFNAAIEYKTVGSASDVYVGYEDKELNFDTVQDAVDAITATRSGSSRITLHIAPGTYREQIMIDTPNLTLKADKGRVKLTWYYGIGYVYYSAKEGFYNAESAYNKLNKGSVDKWGASVYVKGNAEGFKAEGITFENSFNRYVTAEEIADGVEASTAAYPDTKITFKRTEGADVRTTTATERATALAVDATNVEFTNCSFYGSQDTLYTHKGTRGYFNNCTITGNTDFIFGYGDYVFESCVLKYEGYSDANKKHSYLTANRGEDAELGYLFNNCTVTGPSAGLTLSGNYLGRPWDASAKVTFKNTNIVEDGLVRDEGWSNMGDRLPYNVSYKEYDTEEAGKVVTQDKRVFKLKDKATKRVTASGNSSKIYSSEAELGLNAGDYFKDWKPENFVADEVEETITKGADKNYQSYIVYFKDDNGNEILMPESEMAKVGSIVKAADVAEVIPGYVFASGNTISITAAEAGEIVCTYKKANTSYKVRQVVRRTGELLNESTYDGVYGTEVSVDPTALPAISGYKVYNKSVQTICLKGESSNVICIYYDEGTEESANEGTDPVEPSAPTGKDSSSDNEGTSKDETTKEGTDKEPSKNEVPSSDSGSSDDSKKSESSTSEKAANVTVDLGNGVSVTAPVSLTYNGKKYKKNSDIGVSVVYNGQTYSGDAVKLKVKGSKNAGTLKVQLKSIKGVKTSKKDFKGTSAFDIDVTPFTVTSSNIAQVKVKKGVVKSVKVTINGKSKKVPKKMLTQDGSKIIFSGNFEGEIAVK